LDKPCWLSISAFVLKLALGEMSKLLLESKNISCQKIQDAGFLFKYPDIDTAFNEINSIQNH
jgi:NAD dependent epimerase/dehydratase family enzyme|tara:strand:- start:105 stop:290 length:186 start_codon:yes stop_codon:yes gene_type:complete